MSAPVLSVNEQKAAVSGKKKKNKTMKNVLGVPGNLKVQGNVADLNETKKLSEILERLLPTARLPVQQSSNDNKESKEIQKESEIKEEFKSRRNQLSLGINSLSRSIKKTLISAALFASDIQPKFLVQHLNLLCTHSKIPFLYMPELRKITKNCLGFPCIAVGFKKDFSDFSEAVSEIKSICCTKNKQESSEDIVIESNNEESEEEKEEIKEIPMHCEEIPFSYLCRKSTKERIFIPDKCNNNQEKPEEFITLPKDDNIKFKNNELKLGISDNLIRKQKRSKHLAKFKSAEMEIDDDDDDLKVPKKKKKCWVIDKVGEKPSYYPTKLMRIPSNPDRHKKK